VVRGLVRTVLQLQCAAVRTAHQFAPRSGWTIDCADQSVTINELVRIDHSLHRSLQVRQAVISQVRRITITAASIRFVR
jgi:hypothetical protein